MTTHLSTKTKTFWGRSMLAHRSNTPMDRVSYAVRATEKLRLQKQFSETELYYSNAATYQFGIPIQ